MQAFRAATARRRLIPYLDFDVIAANPKPFVGYSDITALHVALRQRTGLATLLRLRPRGRRRNESTAFSRERLLDVLTGGGDGRGAARPRRPVRARDPRRQGDRAARRRLPLAAPPDDGHAVGARARGRDPLLRGLQGTAVLHRRLLTQLGHAGKLDEVAGVVVGEMKRLRLGRSARGLGLAALALARGRARASPGAARRAGALQAAARPRQAPRVPSARRSLYARRRLAHADGRRARRSRSEPRRAR